MHQLVISTVHLVQSLLATFWRRCNTNESPTQKLPARLQVRQRRRMLERLAAVRHALLYAEEPLQGAALRFDALAGVADVDDALTMSLKVCCL